MNSWILINVGTTKDGRIVPIFEDRLRSLGQWLNVNGAAIYGTSPWVYQNDTVTKHVWYTSKKNSQGSLDVFAILLHWPDPGKFYLSSPTPTQNTTVTLLGYDTPIKWTASAAHAQGITVLIPAIPFNKMPCNYAWVLKMQNLVLTIINKCIQFKHNCIFSNYSYVYEIFFNYENILHVCVSTLYLHRTMCFF
ncbi:hypothetical protein DPMN_150073 [Dreissena polymorpha]|uniref:alpha-L-fucosidase n=1 Tax=Dreissena polymorpha TaxID=45954 RepID=A0A9D4J5B0_DREPO|nr:hypothetical protein DPMN_150073 [Dreissena polymorpha]